MTYAELLDQLQQLPPDLLKESVVIMDMFKGDGYDDVQFDPETLTLTFGED